MDECAFVLHYIRFTLLSIVLNNTQHIANITTYKQLMYKDRKAIDIHPAGQPSIREGCPAGDLYFGQTSHLMIDSITEGAV